MNIEKLRSSVTVNANVSGNVGNVGNVGNTNFNNSSQQVNSIKK